MSDKLVFVAAFAMPVEAQLARGLLEADGIKAFLTGGGSVNVFSGVQGLGGQIRLQVAEGDADRAAEILAPHFDRATDDGDAESGDDAALWLCPLCGDAVSEDLDFCPACDTPRPAGRQSLAVTSVPRHAQVSQEIQEEPAVKHEKITSDEPLEAAPLALEHDFVAPDMETMVGDDLVRRAFLASLFPFLIPYSLWLLGRLAFYSGKVSPRLITRLYWTIAIDAFWCLCLLILFLTGLRNVLIILPRV
jgi:hypothetical protein